MDLFDLFFKFGLIGTALFLAILLHQFFTPFLQASIRDKVVIMLFFAYSFFGGHVLDSVTSGSLFYLYVAKVKS
jgi:hypothetical protein